MPNLLTKAKNLLKAKSWHFVKPKVSEPVAENSAAEPQVVRKPSAKQGRKINQAGVDLIHHFESLELSAYPDPGSPLGKECTKLGLSMRSYHKVPNWEQLSGNPWTIGFGHTGKMLDNTPVGPGKSITKDEAYQLFDKDIAEFEAGVERLVKVDITDNQFAALVSFAYNVGLDEDEDTKAEGLGDSALLRKLNAGDYAGAADCFLDWAKVKDKNTGQVVILKGLMKRRSAERDLFLR